MKKILFGIALILFAIMLVLADVRLPLIGNIFRDAVRRADVAFLMGVSGLVIAGIGAFKKDK